LQPFGKAAEHGERAGDIFIIIDAEARQIIMLVLHFLILKEHAIFAFGHADRIEQVRIGGDMNGFHVAERGQHHLDFRRLEHTAILFVVAILHLDIGLGEETENLGQQIAFMIAEFLRPVAAILAQRHFFGQPVNLLLALPEFIGPWIFEGLILLAGFEKRHLLFPRFNHRAISTCRRQAR
jgi:hypothetical protein